jgi:ABC-2 type transport system ATP-binding protein
MLTGFIRAGRGYATIGGLNCFTKSAAILKNLGYVPEDITLPESMGVKEYINFVTRMRGFFEKKDPMYKEKLLERFEVDPRGRIDHLPGSVKKRLAIVTAFMHDPDILLLDEPTSGLDPLMQTRLIDFILEEKRRGKTILLATHKFDEVERTCDRVGILKQGHLMADSDIVSLREKEVKAYLVKFAASPNLEQIKKYGFGYRQYSQSDFEVFSSGDRIDVLMKVLSHEKVLVFNSKPQSLEEIFQQYYSNDMKSEIPQKVRAEKNRLTQGKQIKAEQKSEVKDKDEETIKEVKKA